MAQDTQKQVESDRVGESKRGPGRPKGSRSKAAANDADADLESKDNVTQSSLVAVGAAPSPLALDDLRASVDFGFEELHKQVDQLQETIRGLDVTLRARHGAEATSAEVLAELKKLLAAEQRKADHVDQWTRVLVSVSAADRRRYWRIMRVVYRFARHDKARDAERKRKRKPIVWWQLCLLAVLLVLTLYGGLRFLA